MVPLDGAGGLLGQEMQRVEGLLTDLPRTTSATIRILRGLLRMYFRS